MAQRPSTCRAVSRSFPRVDVDCRLCLDDNVREPLLTSQHAGVNFDSATRTPQGCAESGGLNARMQEATTQADAARDALSARVPGVMRAVGDHFVTKSAIKAFAGTRTGR
jgi:hypothetical protein